MNYNLKCSYCQQEFSRKLNAEKNSENVYCSRSCSNFGKPRRKLEGKCQTCQTPISNSRKFCEDCFYLYLNQNKEASKEKKKIRMRKIVKDSHRKLKEKSIEYKGNKCECCGYSRWRGALQFHHINPLEKDFTISGKTISWERLKKELDKCLMLCANCHSELHGNIITYNFESKIFELPVH